jgi:hypothetical protein
VQHYSRMSARLAGINGAAYPHVLQTMMTQVLDVSKTCDCALGTHVPSRIARLAEPLYI